MSSARNMHQGTSLISIELSHLVPPQKERGLGPSLDEGQLWLENPLLPLHMSNICLYFPIHIFHYINVVPGNPFFFHCPPKCFSSCLVVCFFQINKNHAQVSNVEVHLLICICITLSHNFIVRLMSFIPR